MRWQMCPFSVRAKGSSDVCPPRLIRSVVVLPLSLLFVVASAAAEPDRYDVIIRHGQVFDGLGGGPVAGDVGVAGDTIKTVGNLKDATAAIDVDARGMAVAPGFINMLSWANDSLLVDGRSQSDLRQGVTLEVFGDGWSMGPLNKAMKADATISQGDLKFDVAWTTLAEYLEHLEKRGVSCNIA